MNFQFQTNDFCIHLVEPLDSRGRSASDFDLDGPRSSLGGGGNFFLSLTLEISQLEGHQTRVIVYTYTSRSPNVGNPIHVHLAVSKGGLLRWVIVYTHTYQL